MYAAPNPSATNSAIAAPNAMRHVRSAHDAERLNSGAMRGFIAQRPLE